ncbi:MAG: 50S ribosomal protein L30 [Bacteroidales bacterium]|jgi:ribosomal protein L30|nr:50S ribosomal protein L30 [Bacteroidales bacterium]
MTKVKITQFKSSNGASKKQIQNLKCLGVRKINDSVVLDADESGNVSDPVSRGMLNKVLHLVKIEKIS